MHGGRKVSSLGARGGEKVPVTVVAADMVTAQEPVPEHPPPLHPVKVEPVAGVAVRVTAVPPG